MTDNQRPGWRATTDPVELTHRILAFFDSYKIGSITPIAAEISAALRAERQRCADIVDRHPDEPHPEIFDPEEIRGCCEDMAARIRSGEP